MKALLVYCHPSPDSFNAGILDTVTKSFKLKNVELRIIDIYKDGFDPTLTKSEWDNYLQGESTDPLVDGYIESLQWCDTLVFVYPTWWYGPPAMLKGWLERVLIPGVAFTLAEDGVIKANLKQIRNLIVFTTCGASRNFTWLVGAPGKRTIMRGLRSLFHWRCRTLFQAHYRMDISTQASRERHLKKIEKKLTRFINANAK